MPKADMIIVNGKIVNIGPWDDIGGTNPLPDGALFVENGEYVVTDKGRFVLPTDVETIAADKKVDVPALIKKIEDLSTELETLKTKVGVMLAKSPAEAI